MRAAENTRTYEGTAYAGHAHAGSSPVSELVLYAAPNRPAKLLGLKRSPNAAKAATTTPPATNRSRVSSHNRAGLPITRCRPTVTTVSIACTRSEKEDQAQGGRRHDCECGPPQIPKHGRACQPSHHLWATREQDDEQDKRWG